tara:strand:- start:93 stop:2051 length:1959 start_codon:yes stop_codon:yes gene_type:complete
MSGIVERLTENIVSRDLAKEGAALLTKWEKTGLLEGIENDRKKNSMAVLLENQAKELLREVSAMANADVEGFAAVAFPIVRRVFGGLIANELVSVQPMSLPSGLIFFLDFQVATQKLGYNTGAPADSLYGGQVVGQQITGGVDLSGFKNAAQGASGSWGQETSFYSLNQGYSSATGSVKGTDGLEVVIVASGTVGGTWEGASGHGHTLIKAGTVKASEYSDLGDRLVQYDPDLVGKIAIVCTVSGSSAFSQLDTNNLTAIEAVSGSGATLGAAVNTDPRSDTGAGYFHTAGRLVRRLTRPDPIMTAKQLAGSTGGEREQRYLMVFAATGSETAAQMSASWCYQGYKNASGTKVWFEYPIKDNFANVGSRALGGVAGSDLWGLEEATNAVGDTQGVIPEIDIKVDSVSVTAQTKKLKAKWTPELGQDLNAYHNLDAEVELTSILSEQIALEIDREILVDLVKGATAGTLYWSRSPGLFVNKETGAEVGALSAAPDFTGTVSEWYETLLETVNDVSARIHRKTIRGGANFLVCSPEVASILEFTSGFRASIAVDENGTAGGQKTGTISKKWDVYVDPYFPRNIILVGRKGSSFLESGYVYAPYVPLQVTPTIFGPEDFVPRKGVMTRYAKKMVRPDMYGLVVVRGLIGEAGATS